MCEQNPAAHTVESSSAPSDSSEGAQQEAQEDDGLSPLSSDSEEGEIFPPEKARNKTEVEVVVTTPKRYPGATTTKPVSSPCSPSPQPPSSPSPTSGVKRKHSLVKSEQRAASSDREQNATAVNVKDMPGKGSPKNARTAAAAPRKKAAVPTCDRSSSEYQEEDGSEERGKPKPVTPKKAQASPRKKPSSRKTKCGDESDDGFHSDSGKANAPSTRKKAVVWSQEEEDAIGEVFVEAHAALQPSQFRERLEELWRRAGVQAKTSQDIASHLRKWKKAAQAFPSTVTSSK